MSSRRIKLISLLYLVILTSSLITYYYRPSPYIRPRCYFVLLAISAGVIFAQILWMDNHSKRTFTTTIIFLEILLLSFSFILTQQSLYKTVMGRDPWAHMALTYQILKIGHIPSSNQAWGASVYTRMPEFHIFNGIIILITEIGYKWVSVLVGLITFLTITMFSTQLSLSIFKGEDWKLALLSALLVGISDNVLGMSGLSIIPNSVGIALVLTVLFITLILMPRMLLKATTLILLLSFSLVFFHSLSYGFMLIELGIYFTAYIVLTRKHNKSIGLMGGIILISLILAIVEWGVIDTYYLNGIVSLFRLLFFGTGVGMYEKNVSKIPFSFILLARMGMLMYLAIAGLSLLEEIHKTIRAHKRISFKRATFTLESLFFVGVAPILTFFWPGIAHRFWYYGEILGSIFVGLAFLEIAKRYKKVGTILSALAVSAMVFLMVTSSVANDDNPLIPQYTLRTGWYNSEIAGAGFVLKYVTQPIASDTDYAVNTRYISRISGGHLQLLQYPPKSFSEIYSRKNRKQYIFVLRRELVSKRYFWLGGPYWSEAHLPCKNLSGILQNLNTNSQVILYSNSNVQMYQITPYPRGSEL